MRDNIIPTAFEYEGEVCTVMQHRLGNTYHVQLTGSLMGKLLQWHIANPDVNEYIPNGGTFCFAGVHIGQILHSTVRMQRVATPLHSSSRMPFR